mmetsp:Transcript_24136/g.59515  ORF Transcript_24136/g.59515 Transcript_24136/m.59515 type:complete len:490 (+) Transcript_24136:362-1831(+)
MVAGSKALVAVCLLAWCAGAGCLSAAPRAAFACRSLAQHIALSAAPGAKLCVGGPVQLEGNRTHAPWEGLASASQDARHKLEGLFSASQGARPQLQGLVSTTKEARGPWALGLRAAGTGLEAATKAVGELTDGKLLFLLVLLAFIKNKVVEHQAHQAAPIPRLRLQGRLQSPSPVPEPKRAVFLDVDNTCIFGSDGNDLGIAFQHCRKSFEELTSLYERLCNRQVAKLVDDMRAEGIEDEVQVSLFTRRATLVNFVSARTWETTHIDYGAWQQTPNELCVPGSVRNSDEILEACRAGEVLHEDDVADLKASWDRLLAARDALKRFLSLDYVPEMVVTAVGKDVRKTAARMGLDPTRAVLWDDNEDLSGDPNVQVVQRFESMPREQREELLRFLQAVNPVQELPEDTIAFMFGAKPEARAVEYRDDYTIAYKINEEAAAARPYRLPSFFLAPSSSSTSSSSPTPGPQQAPERRRSDSLPERGCLSQTMSA